MNSIKNSKHHLRKLTDHFILSFIKIKEGAGTLSLAIIIWLNFILIRFKFLKKKIKSVTPNVHQRLRWNIFRMERFFRE